MVPNSFSLHTICPQWTNAPERSLPLACPSLPHAHCSGPPGPRGFQACLPSVPSIRPWPGLLASPRPAPAALPLLSPPRALGSTSASTSLGTPRLSPRWSWWPLPSLKLPLASPAESLPGTLPPPVCRAPRARLGSVTTSHTVSSLTGRGAPRASAPQTSCRISSPAFRSPTSHSSLQTTAAASIPRVRGHPCVPPTRTDCGPAPGGTCCFPVTQDGHRSCSGKLPPPRPVCAVAVEGGWGRPVSEALGRAQDCGGGCGGGSCTGRGCGARDGLAGALHTRNYCWRPGS